MVNIEILKKGQYEKKRDRELLSAHVSGGVFKSRIVCGLPKGRVIVIRNFPGQVTVDTDKDTFK